MQNEWNSPRRLGGTALCGLLAALAVTGCAHDEPATPPTSTVVNTAPAPAASTNTTIVPGATTTTANPNGPDTKINTNAGPGTSNGTDVDTAEAIKKAIVDNNQMTGSRVEPVVSGGVARLNGTVQNQQQKALAATTAGKTPGVSRVINKLQIIATGGVHGTPATPKTIVKVFNHTTVVHDKQIVPVPVPSDSGTAGSGGDSASGSGSGNSDNGTGDTGNGTGTGSAPAPPTAPTPPGGNP